MYIIRVNENENVMESLICSDEVTLENIKLVSAIPAFEYKEGFSGALKYNEINGIHWEYIPDEISDELTGNELMTMIEEVL